MRVAVVGMGGIGSTFAFQLSRAGHDVTAIARGKRLEQLQADAAVVMTDGQRAPVEVAAALDDTTAWDLVLVTVLASQVGALLPALAESPAKTVMFMFNTFESLEPLREAVGRGRFAFGFPAVLANVNDGKLTSTIVRSGMLTTVSDDGWAKVLGDAGVPAVVHADMESWLRTHAAFIVPFMCVTWLAHQRHAGISWRQALEHARAMDEGFHLVRKLGNVVTPAAMAAVSRMPRAMVATLLWTATRVPSLRQAGAAGPGEPRTLIDMMRAAAADLAPALSAIRP
jgi:2-dehydropantoate 2-reductase